MKIAPSILDANFGHLQDEIDTLTLADRIHLDIMDGHYVPNLSFGAAILRDVSFPLPTEVHLMTQHPESFFWMFAHLYPQVIGFHIEATGIYRAAELLRYIREEIRTTPGIVIDGYTHPSWLSDEILQQAGQILIMSVKSGFGGQEFLPETLDKIQWLRSQGYTGEIEVDGGINLQTARMVKDAGADIVVVGSFLMKKSPSERRELIQSFHEI